MAMNGRDGSMGVIANMIAKFRERLRAPWIPERYGKAPFFWMLSFVVFGWKYIYQTPSGLELAMIALSIVIFLPVYAYSFWVHDWRAAVCIFVVALFGVVWAPLNFGGSSFVIFAATMCSRFPQKRHAYLGLGLVLGSVAIISYIWKFPSYFWIPAVLFSIPSALGAIVGENLDRANAKLFRKQEEIEHLAALAERERIARDLHYLLGHTLSVITLKAELARKLFERDNEACKKEISDIEQTARHALSEVRAAVLGYRDTGLAHELRGAKNTLDSANVALISDVDPTPLPAAVENIIALALREAVTNIIRHSQANQCRLDLQVRDQQVHFHISDNGFAGMKAMPALVKGNGLTGMSERVRALGGQLQITCKEGVAIDMRLPLNVSI
jgi:two-component system sensor histidine kinase DesK